MTVLMTPDLANFSGNVHGGTILKLLDQVAAIRCVEPHCAATWSRNVGSTKVIFATWSSSSGSCRLHVAAEVRQVGRHQHRHRQFVGGQVHGRSIARAWHPVTVVVAYTRPQQKSIAPPSAGVNMIEAVDSKAPPQSPPIAHNVAEDELLCVLVARVSRSDQKARRADDATVSRVYGLARGITRNCSAPRT